MGELLLFRPRPRQTSALPLGHQMDAEILLFTGVHYMREEDVQPLIDAPPRGPGKGPNKIARGKKRPA